MTYCLIETFSNLVRQGVSSRPPKPERLRQRAGHFVRDQPWKKPGDRIMFQVYLLVKQIDKIHDPFSVLSQPSRTPYTVLRFARFERAYRNAVIWLRLVPGARLSRASNHDPPVFLGSYVREHSSFTHYVDQEY